MKKMIREKLKAITLSARQKKAAMMTAVTGLLMTVMAFAVSANTTTPQFNLDFDVQAMFQWAQTIISALMPVVYITMGLGLGFLIINALRSAFRT
jgi:hypothetical protein